MRDLVAHDGPDPLDRGDRRRARLGEEVGFAEEDRGRVLHAAGGEIGNRHQVQFLERIRHRKVAVVEREDLLRRVERHPAKIFLVGCAADAEREPIGGGRQTLEIANGERHEIRGHPRRLGEPEGVPSGARSPRVGEHPAVRDPVVPAVEDQGDGEGGLVRRFVERGKGASRVG